MLMVRDLKIIILWVLLFLLPGCASLTSRDSVATTAHPLAVEAETALELPNVNLSGEILYHLLSADIAVYRQQFGLAAQLYLQVAKETRDPRLAEQATRMALFSRSDKNALEAAQLWLELIPDSRSVREAIITAYIRNGDELGVQEHLEYLLAHHVGDDSQAFSLIISMLQHEKDAQLTYKVMRQLAENHADNAEALYAFAYIATNARVLDVARKNIEQALALRPEWFKAMSLYARIIGLQGKTYEAAVYIAGMLNEFPQAVGLRLIYARVLVENMQLDEALAQYLTLIEHNPKNDDALFVAGLLSLQLNDLSQASRLLQQLLELDRRLDDVHYYLGQIAIFRDKIDLAIEHYTKVTKGEHFLDAQLGKVLLLARRGDLLLAQEHLKKLRDHMPEDTSQISAIEGRILEEDGQFAAAMRVFAAALQVNPDEKDLLYNQALLAEQMGLYEQAEKNLLRILAMEPDNISALNALGFSLADRGSRYQEAYGYIQRALELRPHSAAIIDSMGWVLYRLGRLDEALVYLRQSLDINQDQEVAAHLGEVLWMLGEQNAARSVWHQALDRAPEDENILNVMKRFGQ